MSGPLVALAGGPRAPHPLHAPDRLWPETSCYTDLWIELLAALGHAPEAGLGFTAAVAYEGDQFTFLKPPLADLEALFGLRVVELALFEDLAGHIAVQLARGRPVLVEVDAFYLPDTRATTWHREHAKTTIAVTAWDPAAGRIAYVHNAGWFEVDGEDASGLLRRRPEQLACPHHLPPYAELVDRRPPPSAEKLLERARERLEGHVEAALRVEPIELWRSHLPGQIDRLMGAPIAAFHRWAFNLPRQLGAAFELLASHLDWLERAGVDGVGAAIGPSLEAATAARTLQLRIARAVHRKRPIDPKPFLDTLQAARATALGALGAGLGLRP